MSNWKIILPGTTCRPVCLIAQLSQDMLNMKRFGLNHLLIQDSSTKKNHMKVVWFHFVFFFLLSSSHELFKIV